MADIKFSEAVANVLAEHGITHVFGIIGSANAHLFDSVCHHPGLTLVCLHHEQSCVMAAHGYYKQSGRMAAVLVTAGAGAVNALTGVVGSYADSVPVLVITGQEATKQFKANNLARMVGVLGVYTERIFESCTKRVTTCMSVEKAFSEILYALKLCTTPRYGPCIVDIPIDVQSGSIDLEVIEQLRAKASSTIIPVPGGLAEHELSSLTTAIKDAKEPLLWLGDGLRSVPPSKLQSLVSGLGIPYLTSWAATDLFDNIPSLYAGHAGVYGSRAGNLALQSCDLLLAIGTRLSVPQKGYVDSELARRAQIYVVDCDPVELEKLGPRFSSKFLADAPTVLEQLHKALSASPWLNEEWLQHIAQLRSTFPLVESCHKSDTWINSYPFLADLGQLAPSNTTFVTDVGTAFLTAGQVLEPNGGQRLIMSQGLGEMGYGLTGAIGAWFADNSRLIVCLNTDGGLMMNLQELHSVISNRIPLKLVIFNNDGYLMMRHTQTAIVDGRRSGTDPQSGLSIPNYEPLVKVFGFDYISLRSGDNLTEKTEKFLAADGAVVLEVFMDPDQLLVPKLSVSIAPDGSFVSPPLEDLSPPIPLDQLKKYLLAPVLPNSEAIARPSADA
ncbi:MAG: thiamine pyrophosphate-binding protein [Cyanobium sp. PLM2.Bin73]|nr:MAG: thiamine pyrophosphate-binding protein [Cyanobium sp. PLM2.Bin73]